MNDDHGYPPPGLSAPAAFWPVTLSERLRDRISSELGDKATAAARDGFIGALPVLLASAYAFSSKTAGDPMLKRLALIERRARALRLALADLAKPEQADTLTALETHTRDWERVDPASRLCCIDGAALTHEDGRAARWWAVARDVELAARNAASCIPPASRQAKPTDVNRKRLAFMLADAYRRHLDGGGSVAAFKRVLWAIGDELDPPIHFGDDITAEALARLIGSGGFDRKRKRIKPPSP